MVSAFEGNQVHNEVALVPGGLRDDMGLLHPSRLISRIA
jgi:hypothetical protein